MNDRIRLCALVTAMTLFTSVAEAATDVEELRTLHAKVIRAHQESSIDLLLEDEAEDYVVAGRGEVTRPTLAERKALLAPYLQQTRFEEYRDVGDPIVTISADGTLGWVVVQVKARGIQQRADGGTTPIEFECAWIELYEKRKDRWLRVGNVSNFKEQE